MTDELLEKNGAKRLAVRGAADVAAGDIFNDFDKWEDDCLWPGVSQEFGASEVSDDDNPLDLEITSQMRSSNLRQNVKEAKITANELLTAEGEPPKRHIELRLPTDMTYNVGDYLAVLPINPVKTVKRVLRRFGLPWDSVVTIKPGKNTTLPTAVPVSVFDLLSSYVELSQPATKKVSISTRPT